MRLAIVRHNATHAGGAETYADTVAGALVARGHEIGIWYETGGPFVSPDATARWYASDNAGTAVTALAKWKPDVLFVQGLRSTDIEASLLAIAPAVLFAHGYAGLCISGSRLHAWPGMTPCTRRFGAACLALYYPLRCGGLDPRTALADYRLQSARRRLALQYSRIVVASHHMAEAYAREGMGERVRVIGLPIDPVASAPRVPSDQRQLLFCGRLEQAKGPDIALRAAARAAAGSRVRLTFAGAGSQERTLAREAVQLAASNPGFEVTFAGWVDPEARDALLQRTDFLLVPSRWPEPFGLVGLEAAAWGVPAVGFDVGGIAEWLRDGVNGRLVAASSSAIRGFASAIRECLALDASALARLRDGARAIAQRFSIQAHAAALEAVLDEVRAGGP